MVLWDSCSAPRLWGAIPKWQQYGCSLPWCWETLCPLAAQPPTIGTVFGWCTGPDFWVNFKGCQEQGFGSTSRDARSRDLLWVIFRGMGATGKGLERGTSLCWRDFGEGWCNSVKAAGGCSLSPSHL